MMNAAINGRSITIQQQPDQRVPQVTWTSTDVGAGNNFVPIGVTVDTGCGWSATSLTGNFWIMPGDTPLTHWEGGSGTGTIRLWVENNPQPWPRSGQYLIAGHVVTVNQAGNGDSGPEAISYLHLDALGSVRMVTGPAQHVVSRYHYMPFGTEWGSTGDGSVSSLRFAGKERDGETAGGTGSQVQDYFGTRYYASQTGRFTTVDPILDIELALVDPQRWNRYAYELNNPLKFTDPDGENPVLVVGGIIWDLYEIGSSIYTTYQTVRDPNASTTEKLTTGGLFVAGMLPGGAGRRSDSGESNDPPR